MQGASLQGKICLVTGAAQGIGEAIARAFAARGAHAIVSDLQDAHANATAQVIRDAGGMASALVLDVGDADSITHAFAAITRNHGRIDVLVNNAGIGINAPFLDMALADFERSLKINLTGSFLCGQRAARMMVKQNTGRIINIVSISGQRGGTGRTGYGASKAGLELMTKVMAIELAPHGITVNAIAPGPVDTELARKVHANDGTREAYLYLVPQHRYGEAKEIAAAAAFLASDEASYINGHTINVDGGFGAAGLMVPLPQQDKTP